MVDLPIDKSIKTVFPRKVHQSVGCVGCFSFNFVEHETFRFEFRILATVASLCNIQKVYTA